MYCCYLIDWFVRSVWKPCWSKVNYFVVLCSCYCTFLKKIFPFTFLSRCIKLLLAILSILQKRENFLNCIKTFQCIYLSYYWGYIVKFCLKTSFIKMFPIPTWWACRRRRAIAATTPTGSASSPACSPPAGQTCGCGTAVQGRGTMDKV